MQPKTQTSHVLQREEHCGTFACLPVNERLKETGKKISSEKEYRFTEVQHWKKKRKETKRSVV